MRHPAFERDMLRRIYGEIRMQREGHAAAKFGRVAVMASRCRRTRGDVLGSNVAALASLAISGHVLYALALPAAAFGMAGNYLGSTLAITKGSRVIRGILILVLALLMGKLLMDVLGIRF